MNPRGGFLRLRMVAGTLEINEGSHIQALDVYEGVSVYLKGNVSMDYLYLDDNTEFIFALDSSIDLNGGNFDFYDVKLVLMVDDESQRRGCGY